MIMKVLPFEAAKQWVITSIDKTQSFYNISFFSM